MYFFNSISPLDVGSTWIYGTEFPTRKTGGRQQIRVCLIELKKYIVTFRILFVL